MLSRFLQSPEWEEFQKSLGRKTWRVDGVLTIRHDLPGGFNYLYCPRPEGVTNSWLSRVEKVVQSEGSIFLKVDPAERLQITDYRLRICEADSIQPRKTSAFDLRSSEEELFRAMHEKTRYNVRLAERREVTICKKEAINNQQADDVFWKLLEATAERDGFSTHERGYYGKLLGIRSESFSNELFFAEYQGKVLAAALVNFYRPSGVATYLHGASTRDRKEIMAPYLLHWRIAQEAKGRGFLFYDLWGVDEEKWPGLTRFKVGFGGKAVEYPPSVDVIFRPACYRMYKILRKIL